MPSTPRLVTLLALALHAGGALADTLDKPSVTFSGFGTLGAVHSSEDQADFTSTSTRPNGAGYSGSWSASVDTLIAAQATARLTSRFSAVLQVISEQGPDNSYRPHVEWANLRYQVTPELALRAGRTALPIFMVTDSRKVAYANTWVRPPVELYNLVPITHNDGVDASFRMPAGDASHTLQLTAGRSDTRFPAAGGETLTAKAREVIAFADTYEHGFATVRLSAGQARFTIADFGPLFDAFRQFGPQGEAIARRYDVNDSRVTFVALGAGYDPGPWFAMAEWGQVDTRSVLGSRTGWYATGGYRSGKVTTYATFAGVKADGNTFDPGLDPSVLPPFLAATAAGLNAALNATLGAKSVQKSVSLGARWDFARDAAFTVQVDHIRLGAGSAGTLVNVQPGFQPGGKLNVFTASIDFIF